MDKNNCVLLLFLLFINYYYKPEVVNLLQQYNVMF
jgi:hypothetical protein